MYTQIIWAMLPEIFLTAMACLILLSDAFIKQRFAWVNYTIATMTMLSTAGCAAIFYNAHTVASMGLVFDNTTAVIKVALCVLAGVAFIYSKQYMKTRTLFKGEYFVLYLFSILGMMVLISSNNFLTLYLGIELFSLPIYALIAFHKDNRFSLEAALKYFIMGAIASGILLYGVSLLYGVTGNISFEPSMLAIKNISVFKFSLVFIVVGLFFKLGLIPFHMWLPDVYEGSPTSSSIFIATAPKIAVTVALYRVLMGTYVELFADWQNIIIILSVLSIGFGNVVAIVQDNLKRMLAYSTIANMGFAILGIATKEFSVVMFYVIAYAIMYLGVFGIVLLLSRDGIEFDKLDDFRGLGASRPWLAIIMLILMFSLVGIPPMIGFYAKFLVLNAIINKGFVGLAILALLFSIVGVFYCLRLVKIMFFEQEEYSLPNNAVSCGGVVLLTINGLVVLILGVLPCLLLNLLSN